MMWPRYLNYDEFWCLRLNKDTEKEGKLEDTGMRKHAPQLEVKKKKAIWVARVRRQDVSNQ